jgi:hypothetical protein
MPLNLVRDWQPDGRSRVQALPKGAPSDGQVLRCAANPNVDLAFLCAQAKAAKL